MQETLQAYNKAGNLISEYVFEQKTIHLKDLHYYVHTLKQETGLSLQMLHSASAEVLEKNPNLHMGGESKLITIEV